MELLFIRICEIDQIDRVKKNFLYAGLFTEALELLLDSRRKCFRIPTLWRGGMELNRINAECLSGFERID